MTLYTAVAAAAAAASAIIAWAARRDSLRAQRDATTAQQQATDIAKQAADALDRSNRLSEQQYADRLNVEKRRQRAQWAAILRGWVVSKSTRAMLPEDAPFPPAIRRTMLADVNDARIALDEPTAEVLQAALARATKDMIKELEGITGQERTTKVASIPVKLVASEMLIEAWVAEPTGLTDALRDYDKTVEACEPSASDPVEP